VVPDFSKEHHAFTFRVEESKKDFLELLDF
jgi:hypothetical protein